MSETVDVVIVGGGPNGITAAHYMALYGVRCVVLEASKDILRYPRAVGMDDEALRVLQAVGLAELALRDMISNVPLRYYNARGVCFAEVRPTEAAYGWPMRNIFMQHLLETTLREELTRHACVDLRLGHELMDFDQDPDGVTLRIKDDDGVLYGLRARFVIGADGGRSRVRSQLGIQLSGLTHPRKWVVVDTSNDTLDAPYTALHADPARPFVCIYLPYRQRRWEFMLLEHEDEVEMCRESTIRALIRNHIGDAATGLEIIRIRAYTHNSRVAERFVQGRVALIGDAAHLSPPWAGQGLNSGLRDVANLCWKIAAVVKGSARESIVQTYDLERRGHATDLIALADNMGVVLGMTDPLTAGVRDWIFQAFNTVDGLRAHLVEFKFKPKALITSGLIYRCRQYVQGEDAVGRLFVQPFVENAQGVRLRFDEVLGSGYAVIGFRVNPALDLPADLRGFWDALGTRFIQVSRSRSRTARNQLPGSEGILTVEDVDNDLEDWFARNTAGIVIVRPDRFIAAVAVPGQLAQTLTQLATQLTGSSG